MTVITRRKSLSAPADGRPAVHSLNHFVIGVPSLTEAERFHTAFGLQVADRPQGYAVRTDAVDTDWGYFVEAPRKTLSHLSFGIFEADLPRFHACLRQAGVELMAAPPGFASAGLWFRDPDGMLVELVPAPKSMPDSKSHGRHDSAPPGVANAPLSSRAPLTRPTRLAHMLIFTPDVDRACRFYTGLLGLGLSDRVGNNIAFLHGRHGSDHHLIAFVRSNARGLHHTSWDVATIDQIGLGARQMADKGFDNGWGLGRHVLGSNYFHYVRDPWGSYAEYSCDIDYIPADVDWHGQDHDPADSFYIWGPEPPRDFTVNHEASHD
jgi:catechol 2,3-dioxygenase-like lactoylglutathione lyase family enzyme